MHIKLPHQKPILFVKTVIESAEHDANTEVEFPYNPTLAMMVEAAAQSSAFVRVSKEKAAANLPQDCAEGMLIGLKKVSLHEKSCHCSQRIAITYSGNLQNFFSFDFSVSEGERSICSGTLNVILTCNKE